MDNKTLDFDHMGLIDRLQRTLGDAECRRLGFITEYERGVTCVSAVGFGYAIFVEAAGVNSLAEAFATGFECATDLYTDGEGV